MKLSTRSRYGLRLMISLAGSYGSGPRLLKDIADTEGISEKYLGQIVIPLKSAGFITAVRGAKGGYEISVPPGDIRPLEVLDALEGDLYTEEFYTAESPGSLKAAADLWRRLRAAQREVLGSVTLADLAKRSLEEDLAAPMYSI